MHTDFSTIQPWLIAALLVWIIYRRIRRTFGRQRLEPRRMVARIGLLAVIACLLASTAPKTAALLGALAGGLAAGIALGFWAAAHTRFLDVEGRRYYVPHTYAGIAVTLLVVARLAYRATQVFGTAHAKLPAGGGLVQSPLTFAVLFVLVGYYVCFYVRVLQKSKHPTPDDLEPALGPASPAEAGPTAESPPG